MSGFVHQNMLFVQLNSADDKGICLTIL